MLSGLNIQQHEVVCPLPTKVSSVSWAEQRDRELLSALVTCDPAASCCQGLLRVHFHHLATVSASLSSCSVPT